MTKREFYQSILSSDFLTDDLRSFAETEYNRIEAQEERRREKVSQKAIENQELSAKIYDDILGSTPKTATEISEIVELSPQKVSYLMRKLVETGKVTKENVRIAGKSGRYVAYRRA